MIEELQRSLVFFSRANSTLKQQNEELSRLLRDAQTKVAAMSSGANTDSSPVNENSAISPLEGQGTVHVGTGVLLAPAVKADLPPMQTGATMQAMANFQQAVATAMKAAVKGIDESFKSMSA